MRAMKSGPNGQSYYIHGPGGTLLAEYAGSFSKESPWPSTAGQSSTVTLTWGAMTSATYELCVDVTDDNACSGSWTSMSSATTTTLTNLPAGTYYWQVRATVSGTTTQADAGSWWRFSVATTATFTKIAPVNGATMYTDDVVLYWNSGAEDVAYSVCWQTSPSTECTGTWWPNGASLSKMLESLSAGTYYWQVRYTTDYANYTYPDAGMLWSFTKVSGVSGKFAPENGTSGHGGSVWLNWSAVEDSAYYVCLATTDTGPCNGSNWIPNGGSASKLLTGLSPGTYYWQICVQTGSSYIHANGGAWWRFTVGDDTSEPGSGTSSVTREYIYLGSMLLAAVESGSTLTYYHSDALGSVRAITSASGSTVTRHDYFPFGENNSSLSGDPRKYIGGEQDAETAFDYLGARHYRNVWGRFTSVDPVIADGAKTNPQLWTRYSYGLNNPLRFSDPTGLAPSDGPQRQEEAYGVTGNADFDKWALGLYIENLSLAVQAGLIPQSTLDNQMPAGYLDRLQEAVRKSNEPIVFYIGGMPVVVPGGFRETGFTVDLTNNRMSDLVLGIPQYPPPPGGIWVSLPNAEPNTLTIAIHVHPSGVVRQNTVSGASNDFNRLTFGASENQKTYSWGQQPNSGDVEALAAGGWAFGIVIAAGDKNKMYIYNHRGQRGNAIPWPFGK
jgi:RHS repeat-associated protein